MKINYHLHLSANEYVQNRFHDQFAIDWDNAIDLATQLHGVRVCDFRQACHFL